MRKLIFVLAAIFTLSLAVYSQNANTSTQTASTDSTAAKKKPPVFRATKDQIVQVQKMLGVAESGKLDDATRAAIKTYQSGNGLKATGTLNRATLEKMNVGLTDKQKEIPVSPASFATAGSEGDKATPSKRGPVFRATKDQITQAQRLMKERGMYAGEETGKLDDATREGLKKFQTASNIKATGTLNRETLEKMGITLTDKQKEM
jgi:peptidoglycan hydrolase-like protein with peptidoglycan-binding domain